MPSLKVTVPVGFAVPVAGVTVAVKVTDCPRRDGLLLEARAVVVTTSWGLTVSVSTCEVLPLKPLSPL